MYDPLRIPFLICPLIQKFKLSKSMNCIDLVFFLILLINIKFGSFSNVYFTFENKTDKKYHNFIITDIKDRTTHVDRENLWGHTAEVNI